MPTVHILGVGSVACTKVGPGPGGMAMMAPSQVHMDSEAGGNRGVREKIRTIEGKQALGPTTSDIL